MANNVPTDSSKAARVDDLNVKLPDGFFEHIETLTVRKAVTWPPEAEAMITEMVKRGMGRQNIMTTLEKFGYKYSASSLQAKISIVKEKLK